MVPAFLDTSRISARAAAVLATGCVSVAVWLAIFVSGERAEQARNLNELRVEFATAQGSLRDELAEIGDASQVQAAQMVSLREYLTLQLDFMARDVTRLREDMSRQEATTSAALRELRSDVREGTRKDQPNGGDK